MPVRVAEEARRRVMGVRRSSSAAISSISEAALFDFLNGTEALPYQ